MRKKTSNGFKFKIKRWFDDCFKFIIKRATAMFTELLSKKNNMKWLQVIQKLVWITSSISR